MNMIVGSMLGNPLGGGLDKLTGSGDSSTENKTETGEDPEVVQARIEAEERRQEKHRKIEVEREKMRGDIRSKYGIRKKEDDNTTVPDCEGRIGAVKRKTPEELAKESEHDDSLLGQLNSAFGKAKTTVTGLTVSGVADTVKNFLPFGK